MRLKKVQKEKLLSWIAEGLKSDEINGKAAIFDPPFNVSRQQVDYYRKSCHAKITVLIEDYERKALNRGLARKEVRVLKLQKLAAKMEKDLFERGLIWVKDKKGVGFGDIAEIYEYEEFNKAEIDAYRGVLDDIAKELGHRIHKTEVSGADGGPVKVEMIALGGIDPEEDI